MEHSILVAYIVVYTIAVSTAFLGGEVIAKKILGKYNESFPLSRKYFIGFFRQALAAPVALFGAFGLLLLRFSIENQALKAITVVGVLFLVSGLLYTYGAIRCFKKWSETRS